MEDQRNSYQSQLQYYTEKMKLNPKWIPTKVYADEGISGTQDYKRNDFMQMIEDALKGKFDLLLTKSILRFARNTVDTLNYVRKLKEKNIAVYFEEENINTLDMQGELLLTILSSVAQQESETISSHVKLGLAMKMERGELVGFHGCYGYNYNKLTKTITVNDEEKRVIQFIFEKFIQGYGTSMITRELNEMGIPTKRGNATTEIEKLNIKEHDLKEKLKKLLDLKLENSITEEAFKEKNYELERKIKAVRKLREQRENNLNNDNAVKDRIVEIKEFLKNSQLITKFDKEIFKLLIDKVII